MIYKNLSSYLHLPSNISLFSTLLQLVLLSGGTYLQMSSTNSSISTEIDSQNHLIPGFNIPLLPVAPYVPQPLGIPPTTLPITSPVLAISYIGSPSRLPYTTGQRTMGSPVQNSEYNIMSNSLPVLGERRINLIPQDNSLPWSSGFTDALQDKSLDRNRARQLPSSPESAPKVSQTSTSNEFQQLFYVSRDIVENTYFLLSSFFDVSQIRNLEESHRLIDNQISKLVPFVSQQTEEFNVHEMVKALRVIQNRIEDKLVSFYQSLQERDRMKVVFTLPQLRDYSFVEAVNRSVHHVGNSSVSQSISHSVNESINESTSKSVSHDSSLVQNSSNSFSHVRTSSPKK